MSVEFMILNYATNTIIKWLSSQEVCAVAKALMAMPNPSFDVLDKNMKLVTAHFHEIRGNQNGKWTYNPPPVAESVKAD